MDIQQNVYFTIATLLLAPDREILLFNDGHCVVQHPLFDFEEDSTLPHYTYTKEQMLQALRWFNNPEVVRILEQD